MDYQQYKKLRQDIQDECTKQLEALEMVWKRIQADTQPKPASSSGDAGHSTPNFSEMIRTVIGSLKEDFGANDIQQGLIDHGFATKENVNRLAITTALYRLLKRGEILLVKKGQGSQGSIYRKKSEDTINA